MTNAVGIAVFQLVFRSGIYIPALGDGYYRTGLGLVLTVNIENTMFSSLFSILSFTCFWSIVELKEQEERVAKGWFPKNPDRPEKLKLKFKMKKPCKKSSKSVS